MAVAPDTAHTIHYYFGGAAVDIDVPIINGAAATQIFHENVDVWQSIEDNMGFFGDWPVINLRNDLAVMYWHGLRKTRLNRAAAAQSQAHADQSDLPREAIAVV
jgi:hypothetical protein